MIFSERLLRLGVLCVSERAHGALKLTCLHDLHNVKITSIYIKT